MAPATPVRNGGAVIRMQPSTRTGRWSSVAVRAALAAAVLAAACGSSSPTEGLGCGAAEPEPAPTDQASAVTTTTGATTLPTSEATTATSEPTTSGAPTTAPSRSTSALAPDDPVVLIQTRLTELGFWPGDIDGELGPSTSHAVTAFQKLAGLEVTGSIDDGLPAALGRADRPAPRHPDRPGLEIDLDHQVALLVVDGRVRWVFDISSGAGATPTPTGRYRVIHQIDGIREAPLGTLYRPKYFNDGIALHGYTSVPPYPASHGCVRVTYAAMDLLWADGYLPVGASVTVY